AQNVPVEGYGFRFQETSDGVTPNGNLDVAIQQPNVIPYIQLDDVPGGLEYGKQYLVSVQHRVRVRANGSISEFWSDFQAECVIGLQADIPLTQLQDAYCNSPSGDMYLEDQVQAVPVFGASAYRFTFTGPGGTFQEVEPNYSVYLYDVGPFGGPGLQYNSAVYNVTVESFVNGVWSAPGPICTVAMASEPENTEVQNPYCGGTYNYPDPNYILAEYVYGATGYEWEWTPTSGQTTGIQTTMTNGISLAFHTTDLDLSEGGSWDVRVRALAEGQNGSFSSVCPINITAVGPIAPPSDDVSDIKVIDGSDIVAEIYPNPSNGEQVAINLSELTDENQKIVIEVVDFTGKVVYTEQLANKGSNANFIVDFDNKLAKGMYFVNMYVNDQMLVEKLTVE
ncbi:MAG: T9SS type A sorting domain-containing protein, partial [Flavobacteriales bacterium]|nr:T9SS type A sorting domain-containing protein [Flavobacteriales bacterium]